MGDFLGQGKDLFKEEPLPGRSALGAPKLKRSLPKASWPKAWELADSPKAKKYVPPKAPPAKSRSADTSDRDEAMAQLRDAARDFRSGVDALDNVASKLDKLNNSEPTGPAKVAHGAAPDLSKAAAPAIRTIIDRERQQLTRIMQTLPPERRKELITRFEQASAYALENQQPQALVSVMRAAHSTAPAQKLSPKKDHGVVDLMQAVKAMRAGRLAFLPREVRESARTLIQRISAPSRSGHAATMREAAAGSARTGSRAAPLHPFERAAHRTELQLPVFRGGGVAVGGSYIGETGENDVSVNFWDGDSMMAPPQSPTHAAMAEESGSSPDRGDAAPADDRSATNTPPEPMAGPTASHRAAFTALGESASGTSGHGGLGVATGSSTIGGRGGPARIEGELRIPGLSDWIAKVEGRLKNNG